MSPAQRAMRGVPRLSRQVVLRPALVGRFDGHHPLVVVHAGVGAGKSTTVALWAQSVAEGVWVTLDEPATVRRAFWERVLSSMADAAIATGSVDMGEVVRSVPTTSDLTGALRRVAAALERPFVLVLDRFGLVDDDQIGRDILVLLAHAADLRVVVLTRKPGLLTGPGAGLLVDRLVVGHADLAFSPEETAAALRAADVTVGAPVAAQLHEVLDGNPLAVRAAATAIGRRPAETVRALTRKHLVDDLAGYFGSVLLDAYAGTDYLNFLTRISVADGVTVSLAAVLGGTDLNGAAVHLATAEKHGFGTWADLRVRDTDEPGFRLSTIIRSVLGEQLRTTAPRLLRELRLSYAAWCYRNADPFTAILESVRAGDLELAARALRSCALTIGYLHGDALMSMLEDVPLAALRRHPGLLAFVATNLNAVDETRQRGLEWFRMTAKACRARARTTHDDEAQAFALAVTEAVSSRMTGQYRAATVATDRAMEIFRGLSLEERAELGAGTTQLLSLAGSTYWYTGQTRQATRVFQDAYASGRGSRLDECIAVPLLAGVYAMAGDMPRASDYISRARALDWPPEQRDDFFGGPFHLAAAVAALEEFDISTAQEHIDAVEHTFISYEFWALFAPVQAFVHAAAGRSREGLRSLREALVAGARPATSPRLVASMNAWRVLLHLASGDVSAAAENARRLTGDSADEMIARSLLALISGEPSHALHRAGGAASPDGADGGLDPRQDATLALIRAAAATRLGDLPLARENLDSAAGLMAGFRLRTPLAFLPSSDRAALRELAVADGDSAAAAILGEENAVPDMFPAQIRPILLTPRERRLLHRLATGSSTITQIAADLNVSPKTLRNQRTGLYRKLGATSREDAVRVARRHRLLGGP